MVSKLSRTRGPGTLGGGSTMRRVSFVPPALPLCIALAAGVTAGAAPARGQPSSSPQPRLVIVTPATGPAVRRLQAELTSLDWATEVISTTTVDPAALLAEARQNAPAAAVALLRANGAGELWIVDRAGTVSHERLDALVVLQVVERLRAALIAVDEPPKLPEPPGPVRQRGDIEPSRPPAPDARTAFVLDLHLHTGAAVSWAPGGLSPAGQARLGLGWRASRWLSFELTVLAPVAPAVISADKGQADAYLLMLGLAGRLHLGQPHWWVRPSLAAGVAAAMLFLRGQVAEEHKEKYEGGNDLAATGLPYVEGTVVLPLSRRVRLSASCLVGVAFPRAKIELPEAYWGRPMLGGGLGLEVDLL
jgi:hypothetical protein